MDEQVLAFQKRLHDKLQEAVRCCYVTRARCFQEEAVAQLEELRHEAEALKREMVEQQLEDESNAVLSFTNMTEAIMAELRMWLSLKDEQPNQAWDHLVNAQMAVRDALQAHEVAVCFDSYPNRLALLEHLIFPPQVFMSMGFVVSSEVCSICGSECGQCDHLKGRAYRGEICHGIVREAEIRDISIVEEPGNKHCRVMRFGDDGEMRDIMTWLPVEDDESAAGPLIAE